MVRLHWFTAFKDLKGYGRDDARGDLVAALTLMFLAVPQGVAYAMIAGLPPVMGLYAAAIPAIVGGLFRSSRHVIVGPTNAISLLVGGALVVGTGADPFVLGVTLAAMVGVIQLVTGLLGLGVLIDFISAPVVLGYITGAGVLIGVGQLPNLTGTPGAQGDVLNRVTVWLNGILDVNPWTLGMALGTVALVVALRRWNRRFPGAIAALGAGTLLSVGLNLHEKGLARVVDLSAVPAGLPPLTMPDWGLVSQLLPLAIAVSVLSLVEGSSVGRSIAVRSGQRLNSGAEFVGLGLANLVSSFSGGYPVSGSLSRSALNYQVGARTRMAGVYGGVLMLLVLLVLGPVVNQTPVACLAGLLLVIAWDLIDVARVRMVLGGSWGDRAGFLTTLFATWSMPLDKAIYLGVGVSMVFLLKRFRFLSTSEWGRDEAGEWVASALNAPEPAGLRRCGTVRVVDFEGRFFFGAEGTLRRHINTLLEDEGAKAFVFHMAGTHGMDVSIAECLANIAEKARLRGRLFFFTGVSAETFQMWERLGLLGTFGEDNVVVGRIPWEKCSDEVLYRLWESLGGGPCPSCGEACACKAPGSRPHIADVISLNQRS